MKGAPQSRAGCSQRTQVSVDSSDALRGLARCRCIYGPSPMLEEGTQNPHLVAQSRHWIIPGRRNGGNSGQAQYSGVHKQHLKPGCLAGDGVEEGTGAPWECWMKQTCEGCVLAVSFLHKFSCKLALMAWLNERGTS